MFRLLLRSQNVTGAHEAANEIAAISFKPTVRIGRLLRSMRQRSLERTKLPSRKVLSDEPHSKYAIIKVSSLDTALQQLTTASLTMQWLTLSGWPPTRQTRQHTLRQVLYVDCAIASCSALALRALTGNYQPLQASSSSLLYYANPSINWYASLPNIPALVVAAPILART